MEIKGLNYFPVDIHFFQCDKIAMVEADYGLRAVAIVFKLLCRIYSEGFYMAWDERACKLFRLHACAECSAEELQAIVGALVREGFFSAECFDRYGVLTSKGIQRRFFEAASRRKRLEIDRRELLLVETAAAGKKEAAEGGAKRAARGSGKATGAEGDEVEVEAEVEAEVEVEVEVEGVEEVEVEVKEIERMERVESEGTNETMPGKSGKGTDESKGGGQRKGKIKETERMAKADRPAGATKSNATEESKTTEESNAAEESKTAEESNAAEETKTTPSVLPPGAPPVRREKREKSPVVSPKTKNAGISGKNVDIATQRREEEKREKESKASGKSTSASTTSSGACAYRGEEKTPEHPTAIGTGLTPDSTAQTRDTPHPSPFATTCRAWRETLLADEDWRASIVRISGKGIGILAQLPGAMALFEDHITTIGERHTLRAPSDYARRFVCWWRCLGFRHADALPPSHAAPGPYVSGPYVSGPYVSEAIPAAGATPASYPSPGRPATYAAYASCTASSAGIPPGSGPTPPPPDGPYPARILRRPAAPHAPSRAEQALQTSATAADIALQLIGNP